MNVFDELKRLSDLLRLRKGTTILEIVIYLSLLVLMSGVLGMIALQVRRCIWHSNFMVHSLQQKFLVRDVMRRDMMCASCDPVLWDVDNCVFEKSVIAHDGAIVTSHIGFTSTNRIEGIYDFGRRLWIKKISSRFCERGGKMRWKLNQNDGRVKGVWVSTKSSVWYVRVRNGEL